MNRKKQYYWGMAIYFCIFQLGFSTSIQILENGKEKGESNKPIVLKHDFTKALEEAKENGEKLKKLEEEGKIKSEFSNSNPFLYFHSSPEALAQTGLLVNFETEEDDKPLSLKNKEIHMEDGILSVAGNTWGYPSSGKREFTIENSKITIKKNQHVNYRYANESNRHEEYYKFQKNPLKEQAEDAEKERILYKGSRDISSVKVDSALLRLQNSELTVKTKERYIVGNTHHDLLSIFIRSINGQNLRSKNSNAYPFSAGLHILRRGKKLAEGKYDVETSGEIGVSSLTDYSKTFNQEFLLSWYRERFHKEKGTPLFLLGENTKIKGKRFSANSNVEELYYSDAPESMKNITYNPKEDRVIVFEKNSEASFESMQLDGANIKFEGGKVNLINPEEKLEKFTIESYHPPTNAAYYPLLFNDSQITGNAIFNIKGTGIFQGLFEYGFAADRTMFFTDLTFLPTSKIDVLLIKDTARGLFTSYDGVVNLPDESVKGGLLKFTLEGNTKTYLGYSRRYEEKWLAGKRKMLQEELEPLERKTPEELAKETVSERREHENRVRELRAKLKRVGRVDIFHASDADMHFKANSDLYLSREAHQEEALVKNGEVRIEKDEQGNLSEFTGRLTFDHARIHLRSNLKDGLSDQLIGTGYPIIGEGATLYLKNKGSEAMTGKEQLVLIRAEKGMGSKTRFRLHGGKVHLGGFDYELHERLGEKGKEYYLAHGIVETVRPEKGANRKFISAITNTSDFTLVSSLSPKENIQNKKIKVETKEEKDTIVWDGNIAIKDSQVAGLGGKGILSKNAKLSLTNSTLFSTQGLALDGKDKKELLAVDKNSSLVLENTTGGAALALKDAAVNFDHVKQARLKGSYAIYSNGGKISGNGIFDIDGNIYHKGEGGIQLTLEKGSTINASMIDIAGDVEFSKLHFKDGSSLYVNNYSNANMTFEKGAKLHLYSNEEADQKLDILHKGNRVILTEPIDFRGTDIYFRTNMDTEESDRLELLSTITGTGANLHLNNHADSDMPTGGKVVDLVIAKTPENFKWKLANPVEVGGYFYNARLLKKSNGVGSDIISIVVGDFNERKASLTSTAKGMISSTVADYTTYHSVHDSLFDSLYANNPSKERKHSVWAKVTTDTFETKEYGMDNSLQTILVGVDRAWDKQKNIIGGFFVGHYKNDKKIKEHSGKGSLDGFAGGLYLSYRGYIGFGDFMLAYATGTSKYDVLDTSSSMVRNKQDSKYLGAGVRFGRKFFINAKETFYFEPSAKITYGRLEGQTSKASNGLQTKVDAMKSWTTGAYMKLGYQDIFSFGSLNSYAKVGVTQEILGKYNIGLNESGKEEMKLDGNSMNYGVGMEYALENNSISLNIDMKNASMLKNYYKVSLGYQYKF